MKLLFSVLIFLILFPSGAVFAEDTPPAGAVKEPISTFAKPALNNINLTPIFVMYDDGDSEIRYIASSQNPIITAFFQMVGNASVMENTPESAYRGIKFLFYGIKFMDYKNEFIFDGANFIKSKEKK